MKLTTICVTVCFALVQLQAAVADDTLKWVDEPGKHRTLMKGNTPVVRYMYEALDESSAERRAETYKPYLHVYAPGSDTLLTKGPGGLYPHHRGIYYGFNKITYGDGQHCDTWHCTNGAYQSHEEFARCDTLSDPDVARLEVNIDWHGRGGKVIAHELRQMVITPRDEGTEIEFTSTLSTADGKPIKLDGDPQHAGVQFRASQQVADKTAKQTYYIRTDGKGKPGEARNWNHTNARDPANEECTNRPWLAMSFVVDGDRYTTLRIDNAQNPKPARYSERDYGRFGNYFVAQVTKEKPVTVNYKFWVQPGELSVEDCEAMSKQRTVKPLEIGDEA